MAPKPPPLPPAKAAQILAYLHESGTAHTLKELEKHLPGAVAGCHAMHVKDHLQTLADEDSLRVEKIGSGNWYWSFPAAAAHRRTALRDTLCADRAALDASADELRAQITAAAAAATANDTVDGTAEGGGGGGGDRAELQTRISCLDASLARLRAEVDGYADRDPDALQRTRAEAAAFRAAAERWTDNIWVLEGRVRDMIGDREGVEDWQREMYGEEFVEGLGLAEL